MKQNFNVLFPYLCLQIDGIGMDGYDDPADLLSIVFALLIILLNAHNILVIVSIPLESPSLDEINVDMEEGVRHMDNFQCTSIAAFTPFNYVTTSF